MVYYLPFNGRRLNVSLPWFVLIYWLYTIGLAMFFNKYAFIPSWRIKI